MARQREPPPYRDHVLCSRLQAIESVCRGEVYSRPGGASANGAWATATPTAEVVLSVRERQVSKTHAK